MTLEDFTRITVNVVASDGVDEYVPTLLFTDTREVHAVEGIPESVADRDAIQEVVRRQGRENREFFFGVRSAGARITTGHVRPGHEPEFMEIDCSKDKYPVTLIPRPDWWDL
jgi:hypothetical protein